MNILERFSSHLRAVLAQSIKMAAELKNPSVEPVHLLFVLCNEKGSVATEILGRLKIHQRTLEDAVLRLPTSKEKAVQKDTNELTITPFSPQAKGALEKAMLIAQEHQHNYIGTEHLLSALVNIGDQDINDILLLSKINLEQIDKQLTA
ncbi:MAG: Clp protease N-terminal domain-containing protein, partial [bacterium]|nr:Clp protease N-terminal domain-containing protein [bacterium]